MKHELANLHEEVPIDMALNEVLHTKIGQSDQQVERTIAHRNQSILEDSSCGKETVTSFLTLENMMVSPLLIGIINLAKTMPAIQA